ncbi:hypothetical protein [Chondrinema litorale]|uniref:hypothetical protein n=1 Tax=Chondrinema litorale TaxID=2994555 RepID=UPI002542C6D3|nr:hypothetical protein [Chondrinema litorale]UZR99757.1 hypothetical protein OQ292_37775 [Chondrinema litorale]
MELQTGMINKLVEYRLVNIIAMKLFLIFMLCSCSNQIVQEEIDGKWSLCKIEYNVGIELYNVCPEIEFAKDGQGKILISSKLEVSFTYKLLPDIKKIRFSLDAGRQYFYENEYNYKINIENNLEILEISSRSGKKTYILSRVK